MKIFKNPNFNFVRWRWHAIALSLVIILAGRRSCTGMACRSASSSRAARIVILRFEQPPDMQQIRNALAAGMPGGDDAIVQPYGDARQQQVMIRVSEVGAESGGELSRDRRTSSSTRCRRPTSASSPRRSREIVGPVVGEQLKRQGTLATVLALAGILVYIALRFQFSFARGRGGRDDS